MKVTDEYVFFFGKNEVFSNFYQRSFYYKGKSVSCSEVAFAFEKATQFHDDEIIRALGRVTDPKQAKDLGQAVRNYNEEVWNSVRYERMVEVLTAKFQAPDMRQKLLTTGNRILVEASPYDRIWGIGIDQNHPDASTPRKWRGQNLLGQALMAVRGEL